VRPPSSKAPEATQDRLSKEAENRHPANKAATPQEMGTE
jgi:hypothetical protein